MKLFVTLKNYFRRRNSYTGTCINTLALCSVYSQQFKYGIMTNGHVPVLVEKITARFNANIELP